VKRAGGPEQLNSHGLACRLVVADNNGDIRPVGVLGGREPCSSTTVGDKDAGDRKCTCRLAGPWGGQSPSCPLTCRQGLVLLLFEVPAPV